MAILVDFNSVSIANLMVQTKGKPVNIDEHLFRHMVLNSIRSYRMKFHQTHGNVVICTDSRSWRKEVYEHYKASRKKSRSDSSVDWENIFDLLARIRNEIATYLPYPVVQVERAEADDIIAVLAKHITDERNVIISNDQDFVQLQKLENVEQWSPRKTSFIKVPSVDEYIAEHILTGDSGDGIPNFLSDDDTFVTEGKRQRPISKKKLQGWIENFDHPIWATEEQLRNIDRNKKLIDFEYIPEDIQENIVSTYTYEVEKASEHGPGRVLHYLMEYRCRHLIEKVSEFGYGEAKTKPVN
jgi:5'-3' exonuclease